MHRPQNLADFQDRFGSGEPYESINTSLWMELTVPAAEGRGSRESRIFWSCLPQERRLDIRSFLAQRDHDDVTYTQANDRYTAACNAILRLEFEESVIRPLVTSLRSEEFPVDLTPGSRYMSLFANHGEPGHDTRRRSLLHVGGAHARPRVRAVLREAQESWQWWLYSRSPRCVEHCF